MSAAWSPQQDAALRDVAAWLADPAGAQTFYLAGYAGTGKTTLAKEIAGAAGGRVMFGAFTGKAASVLRRKGCTDASTIHRMIYIPEEDEETGEVTFVLNGGSDVADARLVIIDECSMVSEGLGRDLLSFGARVLVLGDPAQLPPVDGAGFFTRRTPDVMLTEVHRQARENPIIAMSMIVREGRRLSVGEYGSSRVVSGGVVMADFLGADQILVGLNRTRRAYNARVRGVLHGAPDGMPVVNDKLVCLKNNREKRLLNGTLWAVQAIEGGSGGSIRMRVRSEDEELPKPVRVKVRREFFDGREDEIPRAERRYGHEFTYGYVLTVHKAQGSQWDDLLVFDESGAFREHRKEHLYTALTRAAERVTIVQN